MHCGGARKVDDILSPIIWTLSRNPMGWPHTGVKDVRVATTDLRINGPDIVLSHSLWFRADEANRLVELLWVEVTNPNEMGWNDDDEIPF